MKKAIRILTPIFLAVAIVLCSCWYLFVYDREFARDVLLSSARYCESKNNHTLSTWFYNLAYSHSGNSDSVAIELAEQYKSSGNYTKAEFTLSNAIADGGGIDLYIALSKTYLEQDKLLDAVNMLNAVANSDIKSQLDALRPAAPTTEQTPGFYNQYITVSLEGTDAEIYASKNGQYPSLHSDLYSAPIPLEDGENTIYAVSVSENGLVSQLSVYGYTVGGVVRPMEFNDDALEAAIRSKLAVSSGKQLMTNDLWEIKEFTVPSEANDYSALQHMAFLESLTIESGTSGQLGFISSLTNLSVLKISRVSVSQEELTLIAALPSLKCLTLEHCSLSGINPLATATQLVSLDLNNNTVRNLDALTGMANLKSLNLQHNAVTSLAAISKLTALTDLDVAYNSISSLSHVSGLTALQSLNASYNSIEDLGDLSALKSLLTINLSSNKLTSVDTLASCPALTDVNVSTNLLTDITSMAALTKMLYFDFSYNEITELPAFAKDCALVRITGSNNKLASLERLSGLENLNEVNMDYNSEISSVSVLADCPVLIEVNVYATKVKEVTSLTDQSIIVNFNPVQDPE